MRVLSNIIYSVFFIIGGIILFPACSGKKQPLFPGVRNAHMMAYNTIDKYVVLFGGADEKQVLNETWILKDTSWEKVSGDAPAARTFANIVYDEANNRFILFGGNKVLFGPDTLGNQFLLNDTWELKNKKWKKLKTENAPSPRAEAAMAYDSERNKIVLFGGYQFTDDGLNYIKLNETWEFDGTDWKKIFVTGPSPRNGAAMIFDPQQKVCILFGGSIPRNASDSSIFNGTTWKWDGKSWTPIKTDAQNIFNSAMAYDPDKKMIIRFGGWDGKQRVYITWQFEENDWKEIKFNSNPLARNHAVMIYDSNKKRVLLFGGHDGENIFGDMWEYKYKDWRPVQSTAPVKRVENYH